MRTITSTAMLVVAVGLLLGGHPRAVSAQERFPRVQYLAGRSELLRPTEITLVLNDRELRAEQTSYSERGASVHTVFTIPLANITAVGSSPRSAADDLMLPGPSGVSSSLTREEYVTLTLRSGDRIDAVLFKVEPQQGAGIAAKIETAVDRALDNTIPQPAKARSVRSRRRSLQLVRVVGGSGPSPRDALRKSRTRRRSRGSLSQRRFQWT